MAEIRETTFRAPGEVFNSYLNTSPISGSGNQEVTWITTNENEGRKERGPVTATYVSEHDPSLQVRLDVKQLGKPIFIDVTSPRACVGTVIGPDSITTKTLSVSNEGGTIRFTIRSNAKKIYYFVGNESIQGYDSMQFGTLSNNYDVDGAIAVNNQDIAGDPGKGRAFNGAIELEILSNATINSRAGIFYIRAYDDNGAYCTYVLNLKQEKATEYLWIGKPESTSDSLTLGYTAGSSGSIDIYSNGNWRLITT